jgi:hypothetical protein
LNRISTCLPYAGKTLRDTIYFGERLQCTGAGTLLDNAEWHNFLQVIDKAKIACMNSNQKINHRFVDINKTIPMHRSASKTASGCGQVNLPLRLP